ncbi:helix-turn-helix domain-containing protein [Microbispora rosea]|uniref:helix-turn-helix domain-containing protein n=1 Tax=Microbispora rosea TaxID=58117 RepID=UPI0037973CC4
MVKTPNWPVDQFAALIDRILDVTGLNKAQLASLAGMNPSQLSRWMSGASRPRFESVAALGEALQSRHPEAGVGPRELIEAAGYKAPASADEARNLAAVESAAEPPTAAEAGDGGPGWQALQTYLEARDAEVARRIEERDATLAQQLEEQSRKIAELTAEVRRLTTVSENDDTNSGRRESA